MKILTSIGIINGINISNGINLVNRYSIFVFFYISFILVPNVWNLAKLDPLLIKCFTENVTDIVLSGYPTENDIQGMKFILDVLTRGHITNIVVKFPSYCLMNILLPLLIYPRSYSLSYLSTIKENDSKQSNIFTQNFILPRRQRKLCLQVEIHSIEDKNNNLNRVLSTNHHIIEEDDKNSIDTTHAVISNSINSLHDSFDLLSSPPNTNVHVHSSIFEIRNDLPELVFQRHIPIIESTHLGSLSDHNRFCSTGIPVRGERLKNMFLLRSCGHARAQTRPCSGPDPKIFVVGLGSIFSFNQIYFDFSLKSKYNGAKINV